MAGIPSITVEELKERRTAGHSVVLIDVREPSETAFASIDGSLAIPLNTLPASLDRIPTDTPVVIYCHHGGRSARAVAFLSSQGRDNVTNLTGGIDAWSIRIDPAVPRY